MIRQIAVIGSGTMGRGIAHLSAVAGYDTVIYDVDAAALDAARSAIESSLRKAVDRGKVTETAMSEAIARVHIASDLEPAVQRSEERRKSPCRIRRRRRDARSRGPSFRCR